jgi:hypothetical protein
MDWLNEVDKRSANADPAFGQPAIRILKTPEELDEAIQRAMDFEIRSGNSRRDIVSRYASRTSPIEDADNVVHLNKADEV